MFGKWTNPTQVLSRQQSQAQDEQQDQRRIMVQRHQRQRQHEQHLHLARVLNNVGAVLHRRGLDDDDEEEAAMRFYKRSLLARSNSVQEVQQTRRDGHDVMEIEEEEEISATDRVLEEVKCLLESLRNEEESNGGGREGTMMMTDGCNAPHLSLDGDWDCDIGMECFSSDPIFTPTVVDDDEHEGHQHFSCDVESSAYTLYNMALLQLARCRHVEALRLFEMSLRAVAIASRASTTRSSKAEEEDQEKYQEGRALSSSPPPPLVALLCHHHVGRIHFMGGLYVEAAQSFLEALQGGRRALLETSAPNQFQYHRRFIAATLCALGLTCLRRGLYEEALPYCHETLPSPEDLLRPEEETVASRMRMASPYHVLGLVHCAMGADREDPREFERAVAYHRLYADWCTALLGDLHPRSATALHDLGDALLMVGRHDDALASLLRALHATRELFTETDPQVAKTMVGVASVLHERGSYVDAIAAYRGALRIQEECLDDGDLEGVGTMDLVRTMSGLGDALHRIGGDEPLHEAMDLYDRALGASLSDLGGDEVHPVVARLLRGIGNILLELDQCDSGAYYLGRARVIAEALRGEGGGGGEDAEDGDDVAQNNASRTALILCACRHRMLSSHAAAA